MQVCNGGRQWILNTLLRHVDSRTLHKYGNHFQIRALKLMEIFSLFSDIFQFKHWGFCVNYQHSLVESKLWEHITRCQGSVTDDPRNTRATASPVSQGSFLSTPPHLRLPVSTHFLLCLIVLFSRVFQLCVQTVVPTDELISLRRTTVISPEVESTSSDLPGVPERCLNAVFLRMTMLARLQGTDPHRSRGRNLSG